MTWAFMAASGRGTVAFIDDNSCKQKQQYECRSTQEHFECSVSNKCLKSHSTPFNAPLSGVS